MLNKCQNIYNLQWGFKEVAYKGLETGSKLIGAHVMQNGSITLEIINTLETIDDDNVLKFPFSKMI